jgi:hypothetical protein
MKNTGQSKKEPKKKVNPSIDLAKEIPMTDIVLSLINDLDPEKQGLIHRLFLKNRIAGLTTLAKFQAFIIIAMLFGFILQGTLNSNKKEFYNIDSRGNVQKVKTSDDVRFSRSQIIQWANESVFESFDVNFKNIDRKIERVTQERYTEQGGKRFGEAIAQLRGEILESQGILYPEVEGQTIYFNSNKTKAGGKVWKVRVPIRLTLHRTNLPTLSQKRIVELLISRVDEWENEKGLGINQIVLKDVE